MWFRSLVLATIAVSLVTVIVDAGTPYRENIRSSRGRLAAPPSGEAVASRTRADPWRRLRPQMTKDDVLGILGAPPWTDRTLIFEFWMYEVPSQLASGVVVFEKGRVVSWRPPFGSGSPRSGSPGEQSYPRRRNARAAPARIACHR